MINEFNELNFYKNFVKYIRKRIEKFYMAIYITSSIYGRPRKFDFDRN